MDGEGNSSVRILDAALRLFSAKGYDATSTREICELAGITKPTLYYFFQSKEGVYRALIAAAFQEYGALVQAGLSGHGNLREKLKKIAELMFEKTSANPELARFLFSLVYSVNSPFVQLIQTSHETIVARIHDAVSQAIARGEIFPGDVDIRMTVLIGALNEAVSNNLISGNPRLTTNLAHSIVDTVFDGWGRRS